jgi:hypothetical protein
VPPPWIEKAAREIITATLGSARLVARANVAHAAIADNEAVNDGEARRGPELGESMLKFRWHVDARHSALQHITDMRLCDAALGNHKSGGSKCSIAFTSSLQVLLSPL